MSAAGGRSASMHVGPHDESGTPTTALPTARANRREAIDDTGEANARRDIR
jgi:hypothetical protein